MYPEFLACAFVALAYFKAFSVRWPVFLASNYQIQRASLDSGSHQHKGDSYSYDIPCTRLATHKNSTGWQAFVVVKLVEAAVDGELHDVHHVGAPISVGTLCVETVGQLIGRIHEGKMHVGSVLQFFLSAEGKAVVEGAATAGFVEARGITLPRVCPAVEACIDVRERLQCRGLEALVEVGVAVYLKGEADLGRPRSRRAIGSYAVEEIWSYFTDRVIRILRLLQAYCGRQQPPEALRLSSEET